MSDDFDPTEAGEMVGYAIGRFLLRPDVPEADKDAIRAAVSRMNAARGGDPEELRASVRGVLETAQAAGIRFLARMIPRPN